SAFAVTERCIRNHASFIRKHRIEGPKTEVSQAWGRRFKLRHPELQCKSPKVKEVARAGAELNVPSLDAWYQEFEALINELDINPANLWNFDETPLQLGWANNSVRIFSTRMKKNCDGLRARARSSATWIKRLFTRRVRASFGSSDSSYLDPKVGPFPYIWSRLTPLLLIVFIPSRPFPPHPVLPDAEHFEFLVLWVWVCFCSASQTL